MKDPIRLRDAKSPHARAARDLLRSSAFGRPSGSGIGVRGLAGPSLDQRDAMWANLAAAIGPIPPGGPGDGPGSGEGPGHGGHDPGGLASSGVDAGAAATTSASVTASATAVVAKGAAPIATSAAAATSGAATVAAPAGKAALTFGAAKLWLALGIGAAGSVGTAAYVTSPARVETPAVMQTAAPASDQASKTTSSRTSDATTSPRAAEAKDDAVVPPVVEPPIRDRSGREKSEPAVIAPRASSPREVDAVAAPRAKTVAPSLPPAASLTPAERASRLRDEAKATADARTALRSGDAAGALRVLADATRTFGGGGMGQEREALTIEALARSGARDAASARAQAFLASWPNSTYAAAVRPFAVDASAK